jgi:hypothetical protein
VRHMNKHHLQYNSGYVRVKNVCVGGEGSNKLGAVIWWWHTSTYVQASPAVHQGGEEEGEGRVVKGL